MAVTVPIDFLSRFEKSLDGLDAFANDVSKKTSKIGKDFDTMGKIFKVVGGLFVADKIVSGIKTVINASAEAEKSLHGMELALKLAGDFSEQSSRKFQELGKQIQRTSTFDDDLVLSQVAVAKQFGATNEETERLIKAAVDLAAATDGDLNKAVTLLGKSLDGTAGKLSETVPEVKALTAAQLAAGDAIDVVAKRFSGAGAASLETYSGALANAENQFGGLLESLGDVITQNDSVIATIKEAGILFGNLAKIIDENRGSLGQLVTGGVLVFAKSLVVLLEIAREVQLAFEILWRDIQQGFAQVATIPAKLKNFITFNSKANAQIRKDLDAFFEENDNKGLARIQVYDKLIMSIADFGAGVEKASEQVTELASEEEKLGQKVEKRRRSANLFADETKKEFEGLQKSLEFIGRNPFETLANKFANQMKLIDNAKQLGFINDAKRLELLNKLELQYQKDVAEEQKKIDEEREKKAAEFAQRLKEIVANPISALFSEEARKGRTTTLSESEQVGVAGGLGAIQTVLGGKEGARKLLGSVGSAVGTAFLGPAGEALGPIVEALSQGPDAVRDMVRQFAQAIPDLIQAIIEALPVLIEELANQLPVIIERLVEKAPDIILALIKALPRVITALIVMVPRIIGAMIEGIPRFIGKLVEGAGKFIGKIVEGGAQFIGKILEGAVQFVGKIIEGAAQFVGKILEGPKLGSGGRGIIPGVDLIPDSVPLLGGLFKSGGGDAGDLSVSRQFSESARERAASQKSSASSAQAGNQVIQVNLQVGQSQLASAILDLNRLGYRLA